MILCGPDTSGIVSAHNSKTDVYYKRMKARIRIYVESPKKNPVQNKSDCYFRLQGTAHHQNIPHVFY